LPNSPEDAVLTSGTLSQAEENNAREYFGQVGVSTNAPIPLTQPRAEYTDAASKAKINGTCLISLVVDRQGMPQAMKVEKTLDPGLDQNALSAVSRYRFKPAMRDGEPVPMFVNIEVNFLLLP
jgi:TonB family protein